MFILYKYTETRAKFNAESFLEGFKGYLETDCYQGYNNLPGIKRLLLGTFEKIFPRGGAKREGIGLQQSRSPGCAVLQPAV